LRFYVTRLHEYFNGGDVLMPDTYRILEYYDA